MNTPRTPTLLQRLIDWVSGTSGTHRGALLGSCTGMDVLANPDDPLANVPRYPPFDRGLPALAPDKIVASQRELLDRLFRSAGLSQELFALHCIRPVELLAQHVHLLPATATAHHRGAGGLFRMSLEVALHTLQAANAAVFPIAGGGARRFALQPRWVIACMLAGLCSQLWRTVTNVAVFDRCNNAWQPLLSGLHPWTVERNSDVYFVRWPDPTPFEAGAAGASAYLINRVVPPLTLQWLADDNNTIIPALTGAINGARMGLTDNPVTRLLSPVITRVIEDDLRRNALNFEHMQIGVQLEPHLVDAMRRLWRSGDWFANAPGALVFVGDEGVYLDWGHAAANVVQRLVKDAFAGVPRDPDTLADMLIQAGVFVRSSPEQRYFTLVMPDTGDVLQGAVRFASADLIFPDGFDYGVLCRGTLAMQREELSKPAKVQSVPKRTRARDGQSEEAQTAPSAPAEQSLASESEAAAETIPSATDRKRASGKAKGEPQAAGSRSASAETAPALREGGEHGPSETDAKPAGQIEPSQGERMLAALSKPSAWLLREIIQAQKAQRLTGRITTTPNAVAISHEEISAHGQDASSLLEELLIKSWLWIDKSKPTRKIHPLEIDGEVHRVMLVKTEIARAIGLVPTEGDDHAPA